MQTLKEIMQAKKLAKAKQESKRLQREQLKSYKKDTAKKAHLQKINDYIPPDEWNHGATKQFSDILRDKLFNNDLTLQDLFDYFVQLHRWTFWDCEYDLSGVRKIIESVADKYLNMPYEEAQQMQNSKVFIHYKHRELLIRLIEVVLSDTKTYTSRIKFGQATRKYLTDHMAYCHLKKCTIGKWIDKQEIDRITKDMEIALNIQEIAKKAKKDIMTFVTDNKELITVKGL